MAGAFLGASEILPKCEVATTRSLSSANTDFSSKMLACYDKILNENLHPYINIQFDFYMTGLCGDFFTVFNILVFHWQ